MFDLLIILVGLAVIGAFWLLMDIPLSFSFITIAFFIAVWFLIGDE